MNVGGSDGFGGSPEPDGGGGIAGSGAGDGGGVDTGTPDADADASNTPPSAGPLVLTVVEGTRNNAALLPSSDPDPGAHLTHRIVRAPTRGTVTLTDVARGAVNYESRTGVTGADSFSYQVNDGFSDAPSAGEVTVQVVALGPTPLAIDPPEQRILGPSVDIDGETLILGSLADAHEGVAFIGRRNGGKWSLVQRLTAGDRTDSVYRFGQFVAMSGDFALVGALETYASPSPPGAAFFFKRAPTGEFQHFQFLERQEPAENDQFGGNPGLSGDRAIISSHVPNTLHSNQVHVYRLEGGNAWIERTMLQSPRLSFDDYFATSAALDGDTIVVGAPYDDEAGAQAGAAYVFRTGPAQENWTLSRKWIAPEAGGAACYKIALSKNTVLCGAPDAFDGAGAVYAFSIDGNGSVQMLRPPEDERSTTKRFGWVVAIDGDTAAIAPDGTVTADRGIAYVYRRVAGNWEHYRKIGTGTSTTQIFPMGLAIDEPTLIATSPIEAASSYVFNVPLAGTDP